MNNSLFVAWRGGGDNAGAWGPVGRLDHDGATYRFCYTQGANTVAGFRPFPQMDDLQQVYESDELFPLFANRLLSKARAEYDAFLHWSGFDATPAPEPLAILGVSEGRRQTDSVEVFPCPVPDTDGCYLNKFFVHGIRWLPEHSAGRIAALQPDEPLSLMLDVQNQVDRRAVALRTAEDRTLIGYVPRYMARDVWKLFEGCEPDFIEVFVDRLNKDAPLQQRVLCRMHACWPDGFRPCSDESFTPIPAGVPAPCGT